MQWSPDRKDAWASRSLVQAGWLKAVDHHSAMARMSFCRRDDLNEMLLREPSRRSPPLQGAHVLQVYPDRRQQGLGADGFDPRVAQLIVVIRRAWYRHELSFCPVGQISRLIELKPRIINTWLYGVIV